MTARKAAIGLCMICALLVSAFAASGASAAATAYTCAKGGGAKDFSDSTCKTSVTAGTGEYGHVEIPANTRTKITGESTGNSILKATTAGVTLELTSTALDAEEAGSGEPAFMENREVGGVMEAFGEGRIKYTNVTANHSCLINGAATATLITNRLKATTTSTSSLTFEPATPPKFIEFTLTGCAISALNKTWTVEGSVTGQVNGGSTTFTHATVTGEKTLKSNGSIISGLEGVLDILGENGNHLTLT